MMFLVAPQTGPGCPEIMPLSTIGLSNWTRCSERSRGTRVRLGAVPRTCSHSAASRRLYCRRAR